MLRQLHPRTASEWPAYGWKEGRKEGKVEKGRSPRRNKGSSLHERKEGVCQERKESRNE